MQEFDVNQAAFGSGDPIANILATMDTLTTSAYMGIKGDPFLGPTIASMLPAPPSLSSLSKGLPGVPTGQLRIPRPPFFPPIRSGEGSVEQFSAFPGMPPGYNPFR